MLVGFEALSPSGLSEGVGPVLDGDRDRARSVLNKYSHSSLEDPEIESYLIFWPVSLSWLVTFPPHFAWIAPRPPDFALSSDWLSEQGTGPPTRHHRLTRSLCRMSEGERSTRKVRIMPYSASGRNDQRLVEGSNERANLK